MHHLDIVAGALPNLSASHRPVCPVSTSTTLIRFRMTLFLFASIMKKLTLSAKLHQILETSKYFSPIGNRDGDIAFDGSLTDKKA